VVFVGNATTGVNTVLRNLDFDEGDVIVYFGTIYGACENTVLHICETTKAECLRIEVVLPTEDEDVISLLRANVLQLQASGRRARVAIFDTVVSFPGIRLPWEGLVRVCKDLGVLSLIDGAHGVGHIDLTHLSQVAPDFFTSNCHK
jgi:selenocysteine lyase/cysteine desulfurase